MTSEELALLISGELRKSPEVEIDGLGVFARDASGCITFRKGKRPRIFVAYATEDAAVADRMFKELEARGYAPWLDRRKLMPGQNWRRRIQDAIESADFFIACFSQNSVSKRGGFQAEIRYALDCATRIPLDDVFLIPVRIDACRVPTRIQRETQYIDLFPDWKAGIERIVGIVEKQQLLRS
ncbi:MAG TPA: toll/interleukin-1 receptor domain-containing protein [Bryobacteraceae bacterium]|nr:toll/interleukin-1 receptor domain-containing protein [Bryobacteraceae bacterium]